MMRSPTEPPSPIRAPQDCERSPQAVAEGADQAVDEVPTVIGCSVRLYLEGIAVGLVQRGGVGIVASATSVQETLAAAVTFRPRIVLIDVGMSGALQAIQYICEMVPSASVIVFAVDDGHDDQLLACAEAGVAGWVGREGSLSDLTEAIRSAARGELVCSARLAGLMVRRLAALSGRHHVVPNGSPLTPREREIADLLSQGMSNKLIARTLSLQLATVKNHVHSILTKLGADSRAEAGALLRNAMTPGGSRTESRPARTTTF